MNIALKDTVGSPSCAAGAAPSNSCCALSPTSPGPPRGRTPVKFAPGAGQLGLKQLDLVQEVPYEPLREGRVQVVAVAPICELGALGLDVGGLDAGAGHATGAQPRSD